MLHTAHVPFKVEIGPLGKESLPKQVLLQAAASRAMLKMAEWKTADLVGCCPGNVNERE